MTTMTVTRRIGRWQNVADGKCPYCTDEKLVKENRIYVCGGCDWFVTEHRLIEWMTDEKSIVRMHLDGEQRRKVESILRTKPKEHDDL